MNKLLKEPLLHFLALGAAIFAFNGWRDGARPSEASASVRIEVTADVIERLSAGYARQFSRRPDAQELRVLVTAHIREEVYCREALALGLDRDDTIVRRRLAQKMEFLTADIATIAEPLESDLQRYFAENAVRYERPGRVSFRHVYFSREKRGAGAEASAVEALRILERGASDETLGDPFLHGYAFSERDAAEVVAAFGAEFGRALAAQSPGAWHGPVASSYGVHLVRVEARHESRAVTLDEVRDSVLRDFNEDRRLAMNQELFEQLRARYEVTVDEIALEKAIESATTTVAGR